MDEGKADEPKLEADMLASIVGEDSDADSWGFDQLSQLQKEVLLKNQSVIICQDSTISRKQ